jgi:hypothetical protein
MSDYDMVITPSAVPPRLPSDVLSTVISETGYTKEHGLPIRMGVEMAHVLSVVTSDTFAGQALLDYAMYYREVTGYDWGVCFRLAQEAYYG